MAGLNSITSPFFQNYDWKPEQNLVQDLVDECTTIYGQDVYYIPRNLQNFDQLMLTDDQSMYSETYMICMYLDSFEHWQGEGDLSTKLGFQIKDKLTWSVSRRSFTDEIGNPQGLSLVNTKTGPLSRPREGDLIFWPMGKRTFVIRYVDAFDDRFYQMGALQVWNMTCELFEYSDETFNTGIPDIDILQQQFSTNILDWALQTEDGFNLQTENGDYITVDQYDIQVIDPISDSDEVDKEVTGFLDFTEVDPLSGWFKEAP